MWKCYLCKGLIYAALAVALYFLIQALVSGGAIGAIGAKLGVDVGGKTGFAAWTAILLTSHPKTLQKQLKKRSDTKYLRQYSQQVQHYYLFLLIL